LLSNEVSLMPPWMPPILTGDHPLPENGVINAPVRTIVKSQSLYRESDDRDMPRISAELVERCPQFFCTFKRERKLKAGFWSARVRPTAQQNEFESIKAFSVNVVIGRRNNR
jgi:hypothetical protein